MLCQQNEEIKSKVLNDMYVEMDCRHAVWLRAYLLDQKQHKEDLKVEDDMFDASILDQIDDFVRFTMVIRFNSVELCPPAADGGGPGENFGHREGVQNESLLQTQLCMAHTFGWLFQRNQGNRSN